MRARRILGVLLGAGAIIAAVLLGLRACEDPAPTTVRAIAVGDMVCDPEDPQFNAGQGTARGCQHRAASDAAVALNSDALLGLGDYQFEVPDAASYRDHYGTSWGRLRDTTIPAVGNQEYKVKNANTTGRGPRPATGPRTWAPGG
jgi:hypothetical protein